MTTRYDRMRRAADDLDAYLGFSCPDAATLRADADELEAVEREMHSCGSSMVGEFRVSAWADALKGDAT